MYVVKILCYSTDTPGVVEAVGMKLFLWNKTHKEFPLSTGHGMRVLFHTHGNDSTCEAWYCHKLILAACDCCVIKPDQQYTCRLEVHITACQETKTMIKLMTLISNNKGSEQCAMKV